MRKVITILLVLYTNSILSQEGWIKYEIGKIDSIYLCIKVKEFACAADDKWIAFEFENKSKDTIFSESWFSYSIERKAYNASGNLAQEANFYPFGEARGYLNFIPPGKHAVSKGMSEEGSCMLGIPKKGSDTTEVFCTMNFTLPLTKNKELKINQYKFTFNWYYPTNEQFKHLNVRLKKCLFLERLNHYYFSLLMGNRRITDSIPVQYYLKSLTETSKDFNFRGIILRYLDEVYTNDTTVINYFGQSLDSNSNSIHDDLRFLINISQNLTDKITLYFSKNINDRVKRRYTLIWLQSVMGIINQTVIEDFTEIIVTQSILNKNLDSLSHKELEDWVYLVNGLPLVGNKKLIPYLLPFLNDERVIEKRQLAVMIRDSRSRVVFPNYRICDVALETILALKGEDVSSHYNHIFLTKEGRKIYQVSSKDEYLKYKQEITEIRDSLIEKLLSKSD